MIKVETSNYVFVQHPSYKVTVMHTDNYGIMSAKRMRMRRPNTTP